MPNYRPWAEYSSLGWFVSFVAFLILIILIIIGKATDPTVLVWFVLAALFGRLV